MVDVQQDPADPEALSRVVAYLKSHEVRLPKFSELAMPWTIPEDIVRSLAAVDKGAPHPLNLFRVHWYNDAGAGGFDPLPAYVEVPRTFSGTAARILVMLGDRFPMISAHKVLAAYACLVPRLLQGTFDPARHRAVWPSTGNYCRGGVAISRILGCRSVAVLPEGMSQERFDWLEDWATNRSDIVRTPGTESNVKEIYDECARLAEDDRNVIINQFSEFGNYISHYTCTGQAAAHIFRSEKEKAATGRLAAFVAATGSAGTIGAGDYLKEQYGANIVAVEATECPTLLRNGYGEHNIQGIGDKHVPLIHNVMNTDCVVGISDRLSDGVYLLPNSSEGRSFLQHRLGLSGGQIDDLSKLGLSGVANLLAACRYARHFDLGDDDMVITVATDSADLYRSQVEATIRETAQGSFDAVAAAEIFGEHLKAIHGSELQDLTYEDRKRIFNLGYYTWVEQQGISVEDFDKRRSQTFWRSLHDNVALWDDFIEQANAKAAS